MNVKELASRESWERSVQEIENVQRGADGELTIYSMVRTVSVKPALSLIGPLSSLVHNKNTFNTTVEQIRKN